MLILGRSPEYSSWWLLSSDQQLASDGGTQSNNCGYRIAGFSDTARPSGVTSLIRHHSLAAADSSKSNVAGSAARTDGSYSGFKGAQSSAFGHQDLMIELSY
ncbi:MAG: hypothetical protein COB33_006435 [Thiotrichaceae bacterium]|nr:hypothetical protein [Thiotrichaceae bacterium]